MGDINPEKQDKVNCLGLITNEVTSYIEHSNEVRLVAWDTRLNQIVEEVYSVYLTPEKRYQYDGVCEVVAKHLCADVCSLFLHDYDEYGQEIMVMTATFGSWQEAKDELTRREELLLSITLASGDLTLENNSILAILRPRFGREGISLSEDAIISVGAEGEYWLVNDMDNRREYSVRKEGQQLKVFTKGRIEYKKKDPSTTVNIWHANKPVVRNSLQAIGETRRSDREINSRKEPERPTTGMGRYDPYVWTGRDVYHCFRNFIGIPIRISHGRAIGMIKLENKNWGDQEEPPKSEIYKELQGQKFEEYKSLFQQDSKTHKCKKVCELFENLLGEKKNARSNVKYMIATRLVIEDRELNIIKEVEELTKNNEPLQESQLRKISHDYMHAKRAFNICLDFRKDLDSGDYSEGLKKALEKNKVSFCNGHQVSIKKEGKQWVVTDGFKEYIVREEGNHLTVEVRRLHEMICSKCERAEELLDDIWSKNVSEVLFNISEGRGKYKVEYLVEAVGRYGSESYNQDEYKTKKEAVDREMRKRDTLLYALNYPDFTEADMVVLSGVAAHISTLIELHITQEAADYGIPLDHQLFTQLDIA